MSKNLKQSLTMKKYVKKYVDADSDVGFTDSLAVGDDEASTESHWLYRNRQNQL